MALGASPSLRTVAADHGPGHRFESSADL